MKNLFLVLGTACALTLSAQDTFSICAVDTVTGEVGSAGASCIDAIQIGNSIGCALISDVHPGVGVIHTQAYYIQQNQTYAQSLMNAGMSPQQIMDSVQVNDIQSNSTIRQYGAVKLVGNSSQAAAFTGSNCSAYASHRVGPNYAIQGNILLGPGILDSMEARFLNTPGDLACKLMAAMQGANVPGADTRCVTSGNSSLSAFLKVADASGLTIDLVVPYGPTGFEPIDSLQVLFNNVHGCPVGIEEQLRRFGVVVAPNPVVTELKFFLTETPPQGSVFEFFDLHGTAVIREQVNGAVVLTVHCDEFGAGLYYYRLSLPGYLPVTGKVVIE